MECVIPVVVIVHSYLFIFLTLRLYIMYNAFHPALMQMPKQRVFLILSHSVWEILTV